MHSISVERCGTRPSCRVRDGPAAPAGTISLSSDGAPCQRAIWVHLQCGHRPVRRARSARRRNISFEQCGAMLSRRLQRCHPPLRRGASSCRRVAGPRRGAGGRTLAGRHLLTCSVSPVPRGGSGGVVQVRRCRQQLGRSLLLRNSRRVYRRSVLPLERARRDRRTGGDFARRPYRVMPLACREVVRPEAVPGIPGRCLASRTGLSPWPTGVGSSSGQPPGAVHNCCRVSRSGAVPCHRAGCVRLQRCRQHAQRASSISRPNISCGQCGAMPPCQIRSHTVLPAAGASGQQHPPT